MHGSACAALRPRQLLFLSAAAAAILVMLLPAATSLAATYTFTPIADGYTRSDAAATSYGGRTVSTRSATTQTRHAYLRFNVALPAGEAIGSATLSLYSGTGGANIELRNVASDSWYESSLTWNSAPVFSSLVAARAATVTKGTRKSFDATSIVTGGGPASMALTTTSSTSTSFNSREANKSTRPKLTVVTVPSVLDPSPPLPDPTPPPPAPDTTAPETTITSAPASPTTSTTASFSFTGSDDATAPDNLSYQCAYDGSAYQSCSSIKTYSPVAVGSRSFEVRAVDAAGNVDPSPAQDTWQVESPPPPPADTTAPTAPSPLAAVPGNGTVVLTWLASIDNVAVTGYRVYRNGTLVGSPSGLTFTDSGLANGTSYSYTVRAIDAAGNLSPASNTATATPTAPPVNLGGVWAWDARNAALDPNNATLAQKVIANVRTPNMATNDWAVATVDAKVGDPEYSIPRSQQGGSITVRIPLGTRPDPSDDGHLTVRDVARGIETDFWQARYDANTQRISTTSAAVSFALNAVSAGSGWTGNAANTPLRRGLITPEDMKVAIDTNGSLPYTLQFGIPNIAQGAPRWPAVHNVPTGNNSSVVEGTWVRLDPAFDVESSGLPAWQKVIARTLQIKGAINRDNSGTFSFYGRNPLNGEAQWSLVGLSGGSAGFSSAFPWSRLQVLSPPAP